MNKKGFTLIEIIGAIIILGIIGIISIQFFTKSESRFREEFYDTIEANFLSSGKEFYADNRIYRPKDLLSASKVTLNTLEQKKYTDEILDYNGNVCNKDSYVIVINMGNGEYVYNACLKCEEDEYDNTIDNKYCDSVWDDTTSTTMKLTLEPPKPIYIYKNTTRDEVIELTAIRPSVVKLDYKGNVLVSVTEIDDDTIPQIYPDNIDIIDTSKLGTYNITYTYEGKNVNGQVIVYENDAPFIKIEKENTVRRNDISSVKTIEKTDYVSGTWGQKLIITFGQGSNVMYNDSNTKVVRYQWKRNGRWIDLCTPSNGDECVAVITEEMNEAVYFRAIDSVGNISRETKTPTILRIDNTLPKCALQLSGTTGTNGWYTSDVNISFKTSETKDLVNIKSEAVSGIKSSGITLDTIGTIQTKTQTADTTSVTWYGFIEDNAENSAICEINFKKDTVGPSATWDPSSEGPHNNSGGITAIGTCTDETSGAVSKSQSFTIESPSNGKTVSISCEDNAGNTATISKTYYVKTYYQSNSKCGCASYNSCDACSRVEQSCYGSNRTYCSSFDESTSNISCSMTYSPNCGSVGTPGYDCTSTVVCTNKTVTYSCVDPSCGCASYSSCWEY